MRQRYNISHVVILCYHLNIQILGYIPSYRGPSPGLIPYEKRPHGGSPSSCWQGNVGLPAKVWIMRVIDVSYTCLLGKDAHHEYNIVKKDSVNGQGKWNTGPKINLLSPPLHNGKIILIWYGQGMKPMTNPRVLNPTIPTV